MQNKYVGDIGDFANNGLLRWLTGMTSGDDLRRLSLGVVWYLYHDDEGGGQVIEYPEVNECDEVLYNELQELVNHGPRNIHAIEDAGILPNGTQYFGNCRCDFTSRNDWLNLAVADTLKAELVFLNPDNGIEVEPYEDNNDSPKNAYLNDIRAFLENGKSLMIYQHIGQGLKQGELAEDRIEKIANALRGLLNQEAMWSIRWRRRVSRTYFVIAQPDHEGLIRNRIDQLVMSPWGINRIPQFQNPHFTVTDMA